MVLVLQCLGGLALVLLAAGIAIRLLYPLPSLELRAASAHITDTGDTPLGRGVARLSRDQRDRSGIHQLNDGRDAFAARILLARAAVRSLDIQYYRSEEHTSELQSLMRISYAVFCLKKKKQSTTKTTYT